MLLRQLDQGQAGKRDLDTLSERYELETLNGESLLFCVTIDDAQFPHEAVVKLARALDEIDPSWQERFSWPTAAQPDSETS